MTLNRKLTILSILFVAVPTLLFSTYLYRNQTVQIYEQQVKDRQTAIEQLAGGLSANLATVSALSRDLAYRSNMVALLSRRNLNKYPIWSTRYITECVDAVTYSIKYQNSGVQEAVVYTYNEARKPNLFYGVSCLEGQVFFEDFLRSGQAQGLYYLTGPQSDAYYRARGRTVFAVRDVLLLVQAIEEGNFNERVGYLVFEIAPRALFSRIADGYFAYLPHSNMFYGASPSAELRQAVRAGEAAGEAVKLDDGLYPCRTLEEYGIVVGDAEAIRRSSFAEPALRVSLVLVWIALLETLLINLFVKNTFRTINRHLNEMDAIVANGFQGSLPAGRSDEIGQVVRRFNLLLKKISMLVEDLVKKETANTAAQLKALQYQMNPHFIYNTLSIFAGNAEQNGNQELSEAIASFGHLLRYNIRNDDLYSTVEQELRNAASLVKVYSIRARSRLSLEVEAEQEVRGQRVIKYLLQPILENSILHGLVPPRTTLTVRLSVAREGELLVIRMADNGAGMSPERLRQVRENIFGETPTELPGTKGTFIGLRNIYERLRLFYGAGASMQVESAEQQGTAVTIRVPAEYAGRGTTCIPC